MKLSFILLLFFSLSSWAEIYTRGLESCDFSVAENYYKQDSEDLSHQVLYAICLVIKGEDTQGVPMLYHLADHKSSVKANFFLADYLSTDGRFRNPTTKTNLDEAINYYFRTQAIIALIPNYPEPDYFFQEKNYQMELNSSYSVPRLYLAKYQLGAAGDYMKHLLQSPSYQGDLKDTFPKYNTFMRDSLNKVVDHAGQCANMPQKRHFNPNNYKANIESCQLLKDLALTLIPLEEKRQEILLQPHCEDLNKANCPEYYETHTEIHNLMEDYNKLDFAIFKHI